VTRTRLAALAASALLLFAGALVAAPAEAGGPDVTLCNMNLQRIQIPKNFTIDACFDGNIVTLRNRTSVVVSIYATGDIQHSLRSSETPNAAAVLSTLTTLDNTLPPGSQLQLWVGSKDTYVQIGVALNANRTYDLDELLLSYLPGVDAYEDVLAAANSIQDAYAKAGKCYANASWVGGIGCAAGLSWDINFALTKLAAQVGIHIGGALLKALVSTVWDGWDQMGQAEDLDAIASSNPSLHVVPVAGSPTTHTATQTPTATAGAPTPPQPAPGYHGGFAATVDKYATTGDSGHKGPGDQYAAGPTYPAGTTVHIYCYVNGESITNSHYGDTTSVWDLSDDGYWYTDAWLFTNSNGPVVPACGPFNATVDKYATTGDSGHKGPGDQYAAGLTYPAGTTIHIYCYVNGESITNSHYNDTTSVWDLSDDGYWYTDAWLFTNSNGPVVPACR
jgi:uncharacterized protein YraI